MMSRALRGRERRHPPHLSNPIKATTAENHLFMRTQADMAICFLARMVTQGLSLSRKTRPTSQWLGHPSVHRSREPRNTNERAQRGTWFEHYPRRVDDIRSMYKYLAWMKSRLHQVHWHPVRFCHVKGEVNMKKIRDSNLSNDIPPKKLKQSQAC